MGSCIEFGLLRYLILFSSGQFDDASSSPGRTLAPEAICQQFVARNGSCGAGKRADLQRLKREGKRRKNIPPFDLHRRVGRLIECQALRVIDPERSRYVTPTPVPRVSSGTVRAGRRCQAAKPPLTRLEMVWRF